MTAGPQDFRRAKIPLARGNARAINRAGVVHWGLFLKNVRFRPPCSAEIIDFEKSELSTSREDKEAEFARRENTRGIAVGMIRAMTLAAAHKGTR